MAIYKAVCQQGNTDSLTYHYQAYIGKNFCANNPA